MTTMDAQCCTAIFAVMSKPQQRQHSGCTCIGTAIQPVTFAAANLFVDECTTHDCRGWVLTLPLLNKAVCNTCFCQVRSYISEEQQMPVGCSCYIWGLLLRPPVLLQPYVVNVAYCSAMSQMFVQACIVIYGG
jgi:hypothetical protein